MSCLIAWLNTNAGAVSGVSAVVSALATVVLVVLTSRYVKQTNKMSTLMQEQTRLMGEQTNAVVQQIREDREQAIAGAQPILVVGGIVSPAGASTEFQLGNNGANVTEPKITPLNFSGSPVLGQSWNKGGYVNVVANRAGDDPLELEISYKDARGVDQTGKKYQVSRNPWGVREMKS